MKKKRKKIVWVVMALLLFGMGLTQNVSAVGKTEEPEKEVVIKAVTGELKNYATIAEYEKETGNKIKKLNEAPMLSTKVAAGEIPKLEQRLPEEPLVVKPLEEIGQYGGTARWCQPSLSGAQGQWYKIAAEPLLNWDVYKREVIPNIAKSWDISENGKVLTLYLRKGMKWSDGMPFTVDDILFWYEDILLNTDLTAAVPGKYKSGGEAMKVERVDDYTVRFSFLKPYGFFINFVAGGEPIYRCKHYLQQFHPKYADKEKLKEMTKEAGFENWYELFNDKMKFRRSSAEEPTLRAWKVTADLSDPYMIAERNPYYWKVDTEGNQLPYIDKWIGEVVSDVEIAVMRAIAGEIDFDINHIAVEIPTRYSLFMENQDTGGYRIIRLSSNTSCINEFYFNLTYEEDPALRDIFRNKKFRIAMSLGIDRDEISELVFDGLGIPTQGHGLPGSPWYVESIAKANTEYDPEEANKLLDEIGLNKRNAEGIRLRTDGKAIHIILDMGPINPKVGELIADHWTKDLGIKTTLKTNDWTIMYHKRDGNEMQVIGWWGIHDAYNPLIDQYHYQLDKLGPLWLKWFTTEGKDGEEPPEEIKRLHKIMNEEGYEAIGEDERIELMKEVMKLWSDNQWMIGTVAVPFFAIYANKDLRNIPEGEDIAGSWWPGGQWCLQSCQWFWKK